MSFGRDLKVRKVENFGGNKESLQRMHSVSSPRAGLEFSFFPFFSFFATVSPWICLKPRDAPKASLSKPNDTSSDPYPAKRQSIYYERSCQTGHRDQEAVM